MSNPQAKAERSKHKDARQSPAPERRIKSRSKKPKPFIVQYRWVRGSFMFNASDLKWKKHGAYTTKEIAIRVIELAERQAHCGREFRLKPE